MKKTELKISTPLPLTCNFDVFDENREKFICRQLDIFDHWLTETEAANKLISYPVLKNNQMDLSEYYLKENLLLDFLKVLFQRYKVISCKDGEHFLFESEEEFRTACMKSIREEELATFHLPELELTIYGNFDMNLAFNFSASNQSGIKPVEDLLNSHKGLYLLG